MLGITRYLQGYRKVKLKDIKGVLNSTDNFKWVKKTQLGNNGIQTQTILPSGTRTRVVKLPDGEGGLYEAIRETVKPNGLTTSKVSNGLGAYIISRYKQWLGTVGDYKILKRKTMAEIHKENTEQLRELYTGTVKVLQDVSKMF